MKEESASHPSPALLAGASEVKKDHGTHEPTKGAMVLQRLQ